MAQPIISWYDATHTSEVVAPFDFGVIDAGDLSPEVTFNIWNNKGGSSLLSTMEDCTITTRDMDGGLGVEDLANNKQEVPVVSQNWFHAQVDSLGETDILDDTSKIGKDFIKPIGTTGSTQNVNASTAVTWTASATYAVGAFIKPVTDNGFIYEVTVAGTTGSTAPTWATTEGLETTDGSVTYVARKKQYTPSAQHILGIPNDGDATNSAGNYSTVTLQASIPLTAKAGKQDFKLRVSYKFV